MGKEIKEFSTFEGVTSFKIYPNVYFVSRPAGGDYFYINYELLNPLEANEKVTDNIVGYSIDDIYNIDPLQIPDIVEKYDIPEMGFKDMTIKEIVLAIQDELLKQKQRKTA